jgi:hypothetical protein
VYVESDAAPNRCVVWRLPLEAEKSNLMGFALVTPETEACNTVVGAFTPQRRRPFVVFVTLSKVAMQFLSETWVPVPVTSSFVSEVLADLGFFDLGLYFPVSRTRSPFGIPRRFAADRVSFACPKTVLPSSRLLLN